MGTVWLARRSDGRFEGSAAVKLLNAELVGLASEERFRREGSILARLAHPHIARLLDAGVSANGQPYLVLEHVEGEHIDRYCDARELSVEARLRLFLDVLAAVAHAHANLIVHRDIKPSNVLVSTAGAVKLLDFGIAKLLEADTVAGEPTALTREAGRAFTPEYAAPEQVTGGPITTATDVYALGILLYVLLTGRHPTAPAERSPAELLRALVDTEPQRLSEAVSDPRARRLLRGDLETIVAKTLKKRPADRYVSVTALADDVRRYLDHQPIGARPDSFAYRAAKFVRRHAAGVATAAAVTLLLAGLVGYYTSRLAAERDRARLEAEKAAKVSELLADLLTSADPYGSETREPTVRGVLDAGAERVRTESRPAELQAEMLTVIGRVYRRLGDHDRAQPLLERALSLGRRIAGPEHARVAQSLNDLGALLGRKGDYAAAAPLLEEALAMRRRLLGEEHPDVAVTLVELGRVYSDRGENDRAEPLFREALRIRRKALGDRHQDTATSMSDLALLRWQVGDLAEAERLFRQTLATSREALGEDHPDVGTALSNLALVLFDRGEYAEAERLSRRALAIARQALGAEHPDVAPKLNNLAHALRERGNTRRRPPRSAEALRIARPALGDDHPLVAVYLGNLGRVRLAQGDARAAKPLLRQALAIRRQAYPEGDWRIGSVESLLGACLTALGRYAEAEPLLLTAHGVLEDIPGPQGRDAAATRVRLVALYRSLGPPREGRRLPHPRGGRLRPRPPRLSSFLHGFRFSR